MGIRCTFWGFFSVVWVEELMFQRFQPWNSGFAWASSRWWPCVPRAPLSWHNEDMFRAKLRRVMEGRCGENVQCWGFATFNVPTFKHQSSWGTGGNASFRSGQVLYAPSPKLEVDPFLPSSETKSIYCKFTIFLLTPTSGGRLFVSGNSRANADSPWNEGRQKV